jgi:hypothetical protein
MASLAALVTPARWVTSLEAEAGAGRASINGAANSAPWEVMGIGMGTRVADGKLPAYGQCSQRGDAVGPGSIGEASLQDAHGA